jgi:hypothetical protein
LYNSIDTISRQINSVYLEDIASSQNFNNLGFGGVKKLGKDIDFINNVGDVDFIFSSVGNSRFSDSGFIDKND